MDEGFVIMQIGNRELDELYDSAIAPAIEEAGLRPRRVDKHNRGGLLQSETVEFIQDASIIVADLTNERPNCYLEVGYAMGIARASRMILTARADHKADRPGREVDSPKIHFDLAGYDILFWEADSLPAFKRKLVQRIQRRLNITLAEHLETATLAEHLETATLARPDDEGNAFARNHYRWVRAKQSKARGKLVEDGHEAFVEFTLVPIRHILSLGLPELLDAARTAQLSQFGFPIGTVFEDPEMRPYPDPEGIESQQRVKTGSRLFDYWALRRNGDFYSLRSLVEDLTDPSIVFFDETVRRAQMLLDYAARLYECIGLPQNESVAIELCYGSIGDRVLSSCSPARSLMRPYRIRSDCAHARLLEEWSSISSHIPELVRTFAGRILEQFDLFPLEKEMVKSLLIA